MKFAYIILTLILFFFIQTVFSQENRLLTSNFKEDNHGRCTGSAFCTACTTCSSCKHCNRDGGSCGVCSSSNSRETSPYAYKKAVSKKKKINYYPNKNSKSINDSGKDFKRYVFTNANVNFRKGPGTNYEKIILIGKFEKLEHISTSGNWLKVKFLNKTGYVNRSYISTL